MSMLDQFNICFERASNNYNKQNKRPGYPATLFTHLRHSHTNDKCIIELGMALNKAKDEKTAKDIIKKHFEKFKKFNNHSFNTYLVDELQASFPNDEWEKFNPKPIVFYQGLLYRGTSIAPNTIFNKGFLDANSSQKLDDYMNDCNGSIGVSMTKNYAVAQYYALPPITARNIENPANYVGTIGYIYQINYRGSAGIDIEETHIIRGNHIRAFLAHRKEEVNVPGQVMRYDIVQGWQIDRFTDYVVEFKNPYYIPNRDTKAEDFIPNLIVSTRDFLFSKSIKHDGNNVLKIDCDEDKDEKKYVEKEITFNVATNKC